MAFYWNLFLFVFYAVSFLIHLNGLTPFFYHKELADPSVNEWYTAAFREFAKTDERYIKEDPVIIAVQGLAGFVNPTLCLLMLIAIIKNKSWRYAVQIIVSVMQAAGAALYFLGAYKLNWAPIVVANDSEKFWGNFIVPNGLWILVPVLAILHAVVHISRVERAHQLLLEQEQGPDMVKLLTNKKKQ
jgi:hypothetical protein